MGVFPNEGPQLVTWCFYVFLLVSNKDLGAFVVFAGCIVLCLDMISFTVVYVYTGVPIKLFKNALSSMMQFAFIWWCTVCRICGFNSLSANRRSFIGRIVGVGCWCAEFRSGKHSLNRVGVTSAVTCMHNTHILWKIFVHRSTEPGTLRALPPCFVIGSLKHYLRVIECCRKVHPTWGGWYRNHHVRHAPRAATCCRSFTLMRERDGTSWNWQYTLQVAGIARMLVLS